MACAKPTLYSYRVTEHIDISRCEEADRDTIATFLDSNSWRDTLTAYLYRKRALDSIRVLHSVTDSLVSLSLDGKVDLDADFYFYSLGGLERDRDKRILADLRMQSVERILMALPTGEITWSKYPSENR